jgi:NAD(P)-dependent dehydrogenase (short-subunit alcohol dehydrogenase family)
MTGTPAVQRQPELAGQTVVVIGGSSGIGLETARRARAEGAAVIVTGRHREHVETAAAELGALSSAVFDATDPVALAGWFTSLPRPVDQVMVTAGGQYYATLAEMDFEQARRILDEHLMLPLYVGRNAAGVVRAGGSLVFITGTNARRPGPGNAIAAVQSTGLPALIANLALELAPIRVNLIAAGFVDTPLSASLLGDALDQRREQLRATLPIRRVVGPADVAALAVHLMTNTALSGATYDIDGGEQVLPG